MPNELHDRGGQVPAFGGSLLVTCACAVSLLVAPTLGGLNHGVAPALGALLVSTLAMAWGRTLVPLLGLPRRVPAYLVAVLVGYAAASLVHLAATALLNLDARQALLWDIALAAVAAAVPLRWRHPGTVAGSDVGQSPAFQSVILLACAALATFWARETVTAVSRLASTGIFPAWQDYFLHASEISYLRDYPAFEQQSQYMTAVAQPLYHRGSYALPALMSAVTGMRSLELATAYWMPTGVLLAICGTYVFGTALGGALAGLAAVAAVYLVPDASSYGFQNRYLSFHWLLQMAAGSGYALAPVLVALTALVTSVPGRRVRAVGTAALLVGSAAVFRVHVALLAGATLGWFVLLAWRPRLTKAGVVSALALVALVAATLKGMEAIALAPHFLSGLSHPVLFFLSVHSQASGQPTPYIGWTQTPGDVWKVGLGYAMMLVAGCGASLVALAGVWPTRVFTRLGWNVGAVPAALVLANLSIILFVPTPAHGDITDFGHRPFVLVYLVFGALAGAALAVLLSDRLAPRPGAVHLAGVVVVAVSLIGLTVPWTLGARVQQRWWPPYASLAVSRDALAAGEFVRTHSRPGDQVLAASGDPEAVYVSLSERRAYVSRISLYQSLGGEFSSQVRTRVDAPATFARARSFEQVKALGAAMGVSWYIADTPTSLQWPASEDARCAYCGDTVRVYDLR